MKQGCLIGKSARRYAIYYCVSQLMYVTWCIANFYRVMNYHITEFDVDLSKLIRVHKLWQILQPQYMSTSNFNASTNQISEIPAKLAVVLDDYRHQKSPPIRIYTGMFDTHLVFVDQIREFIREQLQEAYPYRVSIDSLDSFLLIYSIALTCYSILYASLIHKMESSSGIREDETLTAVHITEDVLFFDTLFWIILTAVVYIALDISMPISNVSQNAWCSVIYVVLLYCACITTEIPKFSRFVVFGVWGIHAFIISANSNASMSNGSCFITIHIISGIFYYVNVVEERMNFVKFIHTRIWAMVAFNISVLILFTNSTQHMVDGM